MSYTSCTTFNEYELGMEWQHAFTCVHSASTTSAEEHATKGSSRCRTAWESIGATEIFMGELYTTDRL
jgi:hypothetical protein